VEELEYLFKHALAQEAAYESILHQKRKELHLKVADSIEKVFQEKIHEFYGILAFHYTQGEDEEKTEKYLIKAGEEALISSASSEALHYFHEALNLYSKKYGDTADPEKIVMLEKNIAHAYLYKGKFTEAVEYFSKVLAFYGEKEIKLSVSGVCKLISRFSYLIAGIYLPFLRWKKTPSNQDSEIGYSYLQKGQCLSAIDAKRFFLEAINASKRTIKFDISKLKKGIELFTGISMLFSWGGISFGLSKKMLEIVKEKINKNDAYSVLIYELSSCVHNFLSGDREFANEYDDDLVNQNLKTIDLIAPTYVVFHLLTKIEQGSYADAKNLLNKLSEIGNVYEHEHSIVSTYYLNAFLLMKYRKLREILSEINNGINFISKTPFSFYLFTLYSIKARIQILMGDIQAAESSIQYASEIESEIYPPPFFLNFLLRSLFIINLFKLEESIKADNASEISKNMVNALKAGKKAVKTSRKVAFDQIEIYKLMGVYYWLINKQKKALKWWDRSIETGERLEGNLELSRTYFEIGKRLLEPKSNYKEWNGVPANEYLEKARTMFQKMDLQYDLDELDKIAAST